MFNRKKIIIGETYLFDVLNETNMANLVSLVTVVKKTKHNKYAVVSVNNGYVFETKAKYLTPYVDPEKATIVRCQYGTTEFDSQDTKYFTMANLMLRKAKDILNSNNEYSEILEDFDTMIEWGDYIQDKIQRYVDISTYKDCIKILRNIYNKTKDEDDDEIKLIKNSDFAKYFNQLIVDYNSGKISLDDFILSTEKIIKESYPKSNLINHSVISNEEINHMISDILVDIHDNNKIAFIINIDDDNNWHIKVTYFTKDSDIMEMFDDIKNFIDDIYPELKEDNEYNPRYGFNIISTKRRNEEEEEDNNE